MTTSLESDTGIINLNVRDKSSNNGIGLVHGICLSTQDIENIRTFVQEFALKALLPYFERQIFQLQDAVHSRIQKTYIFNLQYFKSISILGFKQKRRKQIVVYCNETMVRHKQTWFQRAS